MSYLVTFSNVTGTIPPEIEVSGLVVNETAAILNRNRFEISGKKITHITTVGVGRFDVQTGNVYPIIVVTYDDGYEEKFVDLTPSGRCRAKSIEEITAERAA